MFIFFGEIKTYFITCKVLLNWPQPKVGKYDAQPVYLRSLSQIERLWAQAHTSFHPLENNNSHGLVILTVILVYKTIPYD